MKKLLDKLNYKGQKRISVINAEATFIQSIYSEINDLVIDQKIDPRYPYEFIIIFVKTVAEVEQIAPITIHNLKADGVLWFCYPKKPQRNTVPISIVIMAGKF